MDENNTYNDETIADIIPEEMLDQNSEDGEDKAVHYSPLPGLQSAANFYNQSQYSQPEPVEAPRYTQPQPASQYVQPEPVGAPRYTQPQPAPQYVQPEPVEAPRYTQPQPAPQYAQPEPVGAPRYTQPQPSETAADNYRMQGIDSRYPLPGAGVYNVPPSGVYTQNGYQYNDVKKLKKKKHMPKAIAVILWALLFGIVAAGSFVGSNMLYGYFFPETETVEVTVDKIAAEKPQVFSEIIEKTPVTGSVDASVVDVSAVVDEAMPTVVQINGVYNVSSYFGTYKAPGAGSGIIIRRTDTEIIIATNNHVVDGAESIEAVFSDGTTAPATIKGKEASNDLAVISVNIAELEEGTLETIKVAKIGDSDSVKVGQMAIAIGNALGYGQSTTVGYISALNREITIEGTNLTLLQTDAAINPGNSGGALLNVKGELIGINSAKLSSQAVEGMGFAIPISCAMDILDELADREVLADDEKGFLGIYMYDVNSQTASFYSMPVGVYVTQITEGSAAEKSGFLVGDIVTGADGREFLTATELKEYISSKRIGTEVTFTLQRRIDGEYVEMEIKVELGMNPAFITAE